VNPDETTPAEEGSSEGSSAASSTSSTDAGARAHPFVGDTGPGFNPDRQPPPREDGYPAGVDAPPVAIEIPVIEEGQVRSVLKNGGDLVHAGVGVGELDWVMTDVDQDRIAPPLTRIINKHEQLARVMGHSDELAVAIGAGLYTWRSLLEREAVLKVHKANAGAPPPPPPPPPPADAGPPPGTTQVGGLTVPEGYIPLAFRGRAQPPPQEEMP